MAKKGKLYFLDRYLHEIAKEVKKMPKDYAQLELMESVKNDIAKIFELHI